MYILHVTLEIYFRQYCTKIDCFKCNVPGRHLAIFRNLHNAMHYQEKKKDKRADLDARSHNWPFQHAHIFLPSVVIFFSFTHICEHITYFQHICCNLGLIRSVLRSTQLVLNVIYRYGRGQVQLVGGSAAYLEPNADLNNLPVCIFKQQHIQEKWHEEHMLLLCVVSLLHCAGWGNVGTYNIAGKGRCTIVEVFCLFLSGRQHSDLRNQE